MRPYAPAVLATLALIGTACSGPGSDQIDIGVSSDHPGLSLAVTSERVGLDAAIARQVAAQLGHRGRDAITFSDTPARERTAQVATHGVLFALGSEPPTGARAADVVAVGPYLVSGLQLAGSPAPRRVCVVIGSNASRSLQRLLPSATAVVEQTTSTCLSDVLAARADAVLDDGIVLRGYTTHPAFVGIRLQPKVLAPVEHSVLVRRSDTQLCRTVTTTLQRLVTSGTWARLVEGDLVTPGILPAVPPAPVVRGCT